jgi:hypothetical protein
MELTKDFPLLSGVKATLSQTLEKLEKDLGKHQYPTARVATQNTIMEYHVTELLRVLAKARGKLDLIGAEKDKDNVLKVGISLDQLKAGLEVAKKAVIHEAEIAKVAHKHGMAVVEATEGQTTISKGLDERVQFMVSGIKKDRADNAQITRGAAAAAEAAREAVEAAGAVSEEPGAVEATAVEVDGSRLGRSLATSAARLATNKLNVKISEVTRASVREPKGTRHYTRAYA